MYIISCLPFSKGLKKDSLSYFSSKFLEAGSLIKINIRNKNLPALVLESRNISEAKSEIKSANFQLKKINTDDLIIKPFLRKEFLEAIKETSEYFVTSEGSILSHLIPPIVVDNPNIISNNKKEATKKEIDTKHRVEILQSIDEERFIHYRSLIREEFAKNNSVFICLPQNESIKRTKEKIEKGIEKFIYTFYSDMSDKELKQSYKKIITESHPVVILGTARWLFIPINNIGTIVLEKESENGWKTLSRPYFDLKIFAEIFAKKINSRFILGDSFLKIETLYRYKTGEALEFENIKWRSQKETCDILVDTKEIIKKEKDWKPLSPKIIELIKDNKEKKSHIFVFAHRKGLSPIVICRDCGEQVRCINCESPMVLYKTKNQEEQGGAFKCHQCGETRDAVEVCKKCGSWKLTAFGTGIDKISEEIKNNFPDIKMFEIHKDVTSTVTKIKQTIEKFYEEKGSLLLGTEMALPYIYKKITNTAIVSFDSLFAIPDFRIREKIFHLIIETRNLAKETFLIQTQNPKDPAVALSLNGNLMEFYRKEIEDRKILEYPPFSIFIKITVRGNRSFVNRETEKMKKIFSKFDATIFSSIHEKKGEQSATNAVIKIKKENWQNKEQNIYTAELINTLKTLPPHFEIKIDPDNLL